MNKNHLIINLFYPAIANSDYLFNFEQQSTFNERTRHSFRA
ncbi:MAG: hypothetical protein JWQ66_406 [Mucilaginibacter sp.]|nr:hypothetical protein [Mucilaginibacter sp.]